MRIRFNCNIFFCCAIAIFCLSTIALEAALNEQNKLLNKCRQVKDVRARRFLTNSIKLGYIKDLTELQTAIERTRPNRSKSLELPIKGIEKVYHELKKKVEQLSTTRRQAIKIVRDLGATKIDLYCGSHFVVLDQGELYNQLAKSEAQPRISSHYKNVNMQQYEIRLPEIGALLFGQTGNGHTWFQLEAHSTAIEEAFPHFIDYIKYRLANGDNIGPVGTSPRTENNPIIIDPALKSHKQ